MDITHETEPFIENGEFAWRCLTPHCLTEAYGYKAADEAQADADEHVRILGKGLPA